MILKIHANTLEQTRQPESSSLNLKTKQTVQKTAKKRYVYIKLPVTAIR